MDPEPPDRVVDLFARANDLAPAERAAFLARECGDDTELFNEVQSLLDHNVVEPLSQLLGWKPELAPPAFADLQPGDVVRNCRIERGLGEGGMGVVYLAEQTTPVSRKVALKLIRPGMDTKHLLARFGAERQVLALMDHPCIAKVFDAGATENGRPYFVMEYVDGIRITDYCDKQRLSIDDRLRLFIKVCNAIHHAHSKGIIHRDIKPSNVLVTDLDDAPLPKVIDFGIAKALGRELIPATMSAEHGLLLGTPEYMSPEQADSGPREPPNEQTDVYSLGALLYTLLTSLVPLDFGPREQQTVETVRRIILTTDPARPSTRVRSLGTLVRGVADKRATQDKHLIELLRSDLDWIVMRALEKDRARRYASASALAEDIQRYLDHRPVVARPPSAVYRSKKYLRRHRTQTVGAGAVLVALIGGVALARMLPPKSSNRVQEEESPVVTSSAAALQQYKLGVAAFDSKDFDSLRGHFRDAIGLDSAFAMAYFQWSRAEAFWGVSSQVQRLSARANTFVAREEPLNQFLIRSWFYFTSNRFAQLDSMLADVPTTFKTDRDFLRYVARLYWFEMRMPVRGLTLYKELTRLHPNYAEGFNDLAYCHSELGNHVEAIDAARRYLALQPKGPNAYDTMGDIVGGLYPDSSAHYWRLAIREKSDFAVSLDKLGYLALERGDFETAQRYFRALASDMDPGEYFYRSKGNTGMALVLFCRGFFDDALATLQRGIDGDRLANVQVQVERPYKHALRAIILEDLARNEEALAEADSALSTYAPSYHQASDHFLSIKIRLLMKLGRMDDAVNELAKTRSKSVPMAWRYPRYEGAAILYRADGNAELAIQLLDSAAVAVPRNRPLFGFEQAACYLDEGDEEMALEQYRMFHDRFFGKIRENPVAFIHGTLRYAELLKKYSPAENACELIEPFMHYWEKRDALRGRTDADRVRSVCTDSEDELQATEGAAGDE